MNGAYSAFPSGMAGAALLLLRISTGLVLVIGCDAAISLPTLPRYALYLLAAAIAAGVFTQPAAIIAAVIIALTAGTTSDAPSIALGLHALVAIALAMLGAGAFSIDARLFGRRVIHLGD